MNNFQLFVIVLVLGVVSFLSGLYASERVINEMRTIDGEFDNHTAILPLPPGPVEAKISTYLKARGHIHHADVARACVAAGSDPYLLAAIATIEGANPYAHGAVGKYGAWQRVCQDNKEC